MNGYNKILHHSFKTRYDGSQDIWTNEQALIECTDFYMDSIPSMSNLEVLDIGVGRGRDAQLLVQKGHRVTGLDLISVPEWDAIKKNYPNQVSFHSVDFLAWQAANKIFDCVIDNGCLHHQAPEDYSKYLTKIHSHLNVRGKYFLSVFTPNDETTAIGKVSIIDGGRVGKYFSLPEISSLLSSNGFRLAATRKIFRPLFGSYYLAVVAEKKR